MYRLHDVLQKCDRDESGDGEQEESDGSARIEGACDYFSRGVCSVSVGEFGSAEREARKGEEMAGLRMRIIVAGGFSLQRGMRVCGTHCL